jgi:hypothetical protein
MMVRLGKGGGTSFLPTATDRHPLKPRVRAMIKTDYGLSPR